MITEPSAEAPLVTIIEVQEKPRTPARKKIIKLANNFYLLLFFMRSPFLFFFLFSFFVNWLSRRLYRIEEKKLLLKIFNEYLS